MEETTPEMQETTMDKIKRWFQDNLRIIVSVVIVVVIAQGIYSYSKRAESPEIASDETQEQGAETEQEVSEDTTENETSDQTIKEETTDKVVSEAVSKETETSFVETAERGDGATHLARRALANYLEKNPNSELTKEHKIYIEDYLRKNIGSSSKIGVGTSLEFSKDIIQKAVEQSKNLNDRQLKNLQKYSARVNLI
ncbi:MAG: hypothetical protein ACD_11C00103G0060 [uncultured bacterium]|nr:MAG: hypothetical protein ACD_11C00103G0060 [uncultured bacterium]